jgi:hypothetical protein
MGCLPWLKATYKIRNEFTTLQKSIVHKVNTKNSNETPTSYKMGHLGETRCKPQLRISLLGEKKKGEGAANPTKVSFFGENGAKLLRVEENLSRNSQI